MGSFSINTNVTSLQAQQNLAASAAFQAKTINEVTSGLRIVNSGDDAAGLAVANSLRSDQATLTQGIQNANNGLSTLQTIDGGINNISTLLDRASTLAAQSASGTFTGSRSTLNSEYQSVLGEINRQAQAIGLDTGGTFAKSLSVFIGGGTAGNGATAVENGTIGIDLSKSAVDGQALGLNGTQVTGKAGTDIGNGGATTVANILAANGTAGVPNTTTSFTFTGADFSGATAAGTNTGAVNLTVNLAGVTDTASLVTAINGAITLANTTAAGGTTGTPFANSGITASISTDATGKQQLVFSSGTAAFQVQAGDTTSNALLGQINPLAANTSTGQALTSNATGGSVTAQTLTGAATVAAGAGAAVVLTVSGGGLTGNTVFNFAASNTTAQDVAQLQDTTSTSGAALAAAGIKVSQAGTTGALVFSGSSATALAVATTGDGPAAALGFQTITTGAALPGTAVASGVALGTATVLRVQGSGITAPIDLNFTATDTAATVASNLTTATTANAIALKAAGITVTSDAKTGALSFTSALGGSVNVSTSGDTTNVLGFGSFTSGTTTFNSANGVAAGDGVTAGQAASATNSSGQQLEISLAGGTGINLSSGNLTGGTAAANATQAALQLNAAIQANATLKSAGLVVTDTANVLQISSNNGTAFRVNALALDSAGAQTVTANANVLGFGGGTGATSSASTENTLVSDSNITSAGASATAVYAYNPTSSQSVGFTAYDASGAAHTTSITLQNNTIAGNTNNANTIDQAIASINSQLQTSGDATLSQITAVKADTTNATTGVVTQGIQFISSLASFNVTLGAAGTATSQQGIGTALQQGTTQVSSAGSQSDVSTAAGAATAVTVLANAVTALGAAQANVGKGENLLNYAVALAQTQVTNEAAAESRIRDADLAQQAANLSKAQILVQAGTAALAQANSAPQAILSLLK